MDPWLYYTELGARIMFIISIIVTGIWAWAKYKQRTEKAALILHIQRYEFFRRNGNNGLFVYIEISIKNTGQREVQLLYDKAMIRIAKCDKNGQLSKDTSNCYSGIVSFANMHTGRLRSGSDVILPYWLRLNGYGLYFVEFAIDVDMKRYHKWFSKEHRIVTWFDRKYLVVTKDNTTPILIETSS